MSRDGSPPSGAVTLDASLSTHAVGAQTGRDRVAEAVLTPGHRVGPFVVGDVLGRGGHGIVYEATDTRLHRRLALKFVDGDAAERGRARLAREARALAQIEHPNVVKVFDTGVDDGRMYLAMEIIDGWNLAQWWQREHPPLSDRLRVLEAAGRGLEAAHRVDIVHRDFKPANVMVARSGRVVVTDFGLALAATPTATGDEAGTTGTRKGGAGTLGYMAPEQMLGMEIDARSDQFAFCVVMYESLFGRVPFRGRDVGELVGAMAERMRELPTEPFRAPRWLAAVLERGLAPDPDDRFPSMHALLEAMAAGHRRALTRRWGALAIVGGALAVGGLVLADHTTSAVPPVVGAITPELRDIGADARDEVALAPARAALREGRYAAGITLATAARDAAAGDERFGARVELLLAQAYEKLGRHADALASATSVGELATAWAEDDIAMQAWLVATDAATSAGALEEAERHLRSATGTTTRLASTDARELELARREAALSAARGDWDAAEAAYRRALDLVDADTDPLVAAVVQNNLGGVHGNRGELELAGRHFEAALELRAGVLPADHPDIAQTRMNVGIVLLARGETEHGLAVLRESVLAAERTFGVEHREVARATVFLAASHGTLAEFTPCATLARRALEITERADDRSSVRMDALRVAAECELQNGHTEDAERWAARGMTLLEYVALPPIDVLKLYDTHARAAWANGHRDTAMRAAGRAQALAISLGEPEDARRITSWIAAPTARPEEFEPQGPY